MVIGLLQSCRYATLSTNFDWHFGQTTGCPKDPALATRRQLQRHPNCSSAGGAGARFISVGRPSSRVLPLRVTSSREIGQNSSGRPSPPGRAGEDEGALALGAIPVMHPPDLTAPPSGGSCAASRKGT